jgi:hypothetical protein
MKNLLLLVLFMLIISCGKEAPETLNCGEKTISNEGFEYNGNSICYNWYGPEEVDIKVKRKDGSGAMFEKTLRGGLDNCISGLDSSATYTVSIYKRCYRNLKFEPEILRAVDIDPSYLRRVRNLSITNSAKSDFINFDNVPNSQNYNVNIRSINTEYPNFYGWTSSSPAEIEMPSGNQYEIKIRPIYNPSEEYYILGPYSKIDFKSEAVLTSDLPTSATVACLPIACDTSNLGPDINPRNNIVQKLKYFEDENSTCEIYYYKIAYKNDPPVEFHLTTLKDNNGKYKIYFRDEYCGKLNSRMEIVGGGTLTKKLGQNEYIILTFYKTYFTMSISKDLTLYRKRVK